MDIRFDKAAAEELIFEMNRYCDNIQNLGKDLQNIIESGYEWDDPQFYAFRNCMKEIITDLDKILNFEDEYAKTFRQRVQELGE